MARQTKSIVLSKQQTVILKRLEKADKTPQGTAIRCRIVLLAAQGEVSTKIAVKLGVDPQRVRRWRNRWAQAQDSLQIAEEKQSKDKDLEAVILRLLADLHRNGGITKFSPVQVAQIISLACEKPEDSGLPVSHWTPPELAREAAKRGIVESISPRQVDRFLKGG